ncbi:queuosine biosynthesis protein QueD [Candidatus Omnitrophus magneticus]|uniref:6-carboxy-5,6,7,8-tetrahydropterin synthase n=1 Tax=Candidatus Omnitrophus magneticus TaxID=1609969 RepID=A0A0F0CWA4_9BACT|nr:queuosine biosynthesis protein QueD [Candidatus Omnitrophus magneticus]
MFTVKIKSDFSGAHNLRGYKGKCEDLHGHNWYIEVEAVSEELDSLGMVIDFKEMKKVLDSILNELDHKYLNEISYFEKINPTSENIARYLYDKISPFFQKGKISKVTVWETDSSMASYSA